MLKRNTTVYLRSGRGGYYKLPVYNDLSFSQVYTEEQLPRKTLHNPENLISQGFTSTLNPGNFNFTIPLIDTTIAQALCECLFIDDYKSIFIENEGSVIELRKSFIENIVLNIVKDAINTITVSGSYADSIPSSVPTGFQIIGELYTYVENLSILINNKEIVNVTSINIEVSKKFQWLENKTMHDSGPVARKSGVLEEVTVSGTIVANLPMSIPTYDDNANLAIKLNLNSTALIEVLVSPALITTRNQLDDVVKKGFDFRAKNAQINFRGVNLI